MDILHKLILGVTVVVKIDDVSPEPTGTRFYTVRMEAQPENDETYKAVTVVIKDILTQHEPAIITYVDSEGEADGVIAYVKCFEYSVTDVHRSLLITRLTASGYIPRIIMSEKPKRGPHDVGMPVPTCPVCNGYHTEQQCAYVKALNPHNSHNSHNITFQKKTKP